MIQFKAKTTTGEVINSALSPFKFPAGEVFVKREERRKLENVEIAVLYGSPDKIHEDLFTVAMWSEYLTQEDHSVKQVLVIPYFPGARADKDVPNGPSVYSMQLAMTNVDEIVIFDPHSNVIVEALKKIPGTTTTVYHPMDLFLQAEAKRALPKDLVGIIVPDAGAIDRANEVAHALNLPVYQATKKRDPKTGKLSSFEVEELPDEGHLLIVDDICDGGGTFMGLLGAIPTRSGKTSLYVSHGVFSGKAIMNLPAKFDTVFTTNSYDPQRNLVATGYGGREIVEFQGVFKRIDVISMMLRGIQEG